MMSSQPITKNKKKPLIGVCSRAGQAYVEALIEAGAAPIMIEPTSKAEVLARIVEALDGLLIPGGIDIHPDNYGEDVKGAYGWNHKEDFTDMTLFEQAFYRSLPMFGVCRGLQLINVALSGTLHQDITYMSDIQHRTFTSIFTKRGDDSHAIEIVEDSVLARANGGNTELKVNSFHHQSIRQLGRGLRVTANAEDGVAEAIESTNMERQWIVGVQFHPEEMTARKWAKSLFKAFVSECQKRSALRTSYAYAVVVPPAFTTSSSSYSTSGGATVRANTAVTKKTKARTKKKSALPASVTETTEMR